MASEFQMAIARRPGNQRGLDGEFVRGAVAGPVAHRHWVFSVPKMLRPYFKFDRALPKTKLLSVYPSVFPPRRTMALGVVPSTRLNVRLKLYTEPKPQAAATSVMLRLPRWSWRAASRHRVSRA